MFDRMVPNPPAMGAAVFTHGAATMPSHDVQPPSDMPVSPMRSGSTPSSAPSTRVARTASSAITATCDRPNGSNSFCSSSHASTVPRRDAAPFGVKVSTAKPRRTISRPQPYSGPLCGVLRWYRGCATSSAVLAVPLVHMTPGIVPAGSAGRMAMAWTDSPSQLRKVSRVSARPSSTTVAPRVKST